MSSSFDGEQVRKAAADGKLFQQLVLSDVASVGQDEDSSAFWNKDVSIATDNFSPYATNSYTLQSTVLAAAEEAAEVAREDLLRAIERLLRATVRWSDEGMQLLGELYSSDLTEPLTLSRLMESRARACERLHDDSPSADEDLGRLSVEWMQRAEVVSTRLLGSSHENSVRVMLEVLRLHVKYVEQPGPPRVKPLRKRVDRTDGNVDENGRVHLPHKQSFAALKAADINRSIVQLAYSDVAKADLFSQRCAQLLALSTVGASHGDR